jgi:gas vesicle protein
VIGAGVALLAAPRSGEETRERIRDRVRHIRGRDDVWKKLRRELTRARKVRRQRQLEQRRERDKKLVERERAELDAALTAAP